MLANAKKLALFAAGAASQKYMQAIADQQEVMGALADCIMEVYAMESCMLRAEKLIAAKGEAAAGQAVAMTRYYSAKAMQTIEMGARKVIAAVAEGRHAADAVGDSAPALQVRPAGHHRSGPPDRAARGRGRPLHAVIHPDLRGRVAVVTGASRGIGKALALRLAEEGAQVVIAARSEQSTERLPGSIYETADAVRRRSGRRWPSRSMSGTRMQFAT